jgi:polysaccharide export outer membrane protein
MIPLQNPPASRAELAAPSPAPVRATTPANAPNPTAITSAANDYVLSNADTLEMTIFREADLATRSRVASDGTVQLPLIGDVRVSGLTVREAREIIRKRYDADYLVDPQVYLNVIDYAQRKFTILGQVARPGTYEFPGGSSVSLLQAVGMAGGFTRTADRGKVIVKRPAKGSTDETIKLNAKKMAAEGKGAFEVAPGDVITVGESWF